MKKLKLLVVGIAMATLLGACSGTGEGTGSESASASSAAAQVETKYVVYFRRKSTKLTNVSEGVLYDAMQAIRLKKAKNVHIVAYSVTQRSKRRSQKLAMKRLGKLKKRLEKAGAKNVQVTDGGMLKAKEVGGASKARKAEIIVQ